MWCGNFWDPQFTKSHYAQAYLSNHLPTHVMASAPCIIDMLGDIIYLEVDGVHQDWNTYQFDLDIKTPGKKVNLHFDS